MAKNTLLTIQYTIVHRSIHNFVQEHEHYHYTLRLTQEAIISNTRCFKLDKILDLSYKPFTNGQGFLYLHADEGVFSFVISSDPTQFIQMWHTLRKNNVMK